MNVESVAFPPRNAPHLDAQPQVPPPADKPQLPPQPPINDPTPSEKAQAKLWEAAPALSALALLALVLMVLGALLVIAVRRATAPVNPELGLDALAGLPPEVSEQAPVAAAEFPMQRLRRLEKIAREERGVRNLVVREALGKGEVALVARWTRELGDFLLEDVKPEDVPGGSVQTLAAELTQSGSADPNTRAPALFDLEGRIIAARIARPADSAQEAFAFLEGVRPERFVVAVAGLSSAAQEIALRFAPSELRAAAMGQLPASRRQELALGWVRRPDVSASHAQAVADELKALVAEATGGAGQLQRMLGEVLESLPPSDQDTFLERIRREGGAELARTLITESTLHGTPVEILSAAVLSLPPARLVDYLAGAEPQLRDHLISACPQKLQRELTEELGLRGRSSGEDFLDARRQLLSSLRGEIDRRGVPASEVSSWSRAEPARGEKRVN